MLSVLPHCCFRSLRRCYGVALRGWPIGPHRTSCFSSCRITRLRLSAPHYLLTSRCAVHSDADTNIESPDDHGDASAHRSEDVSVHSDSSSLHRPVLAKEVVDLISPTKGQVRFCHNLTNHDCSPIYMSVHSVPIKTIS